MLPKIIHKIVETSDGPSSYGPSVFTDDTRLQLERKGRILGTASRLLTGSSSNVRELAQFVGQVVSCFQGVKFGPLWYRYMENDKIKALKQNKGDYESKVVFLNEAKSEMIRWTENIMSSFNDVHSDHSEPDFVLFTDVSLTDWVCSCKISRTGGHWDYTESQSNINVLEVKAALLTLQSFAREKASIHVRLMMDNTTAVVCVSKMGTSHLVQCNAVTKEIWQFCIKRNI